MEHDKQEKRYDTLTVVLMTILGGAADAFTLFTFLILPFPIIGLVSFGLAVFANIFVVHILIFWFAMKGEKNLLVWIVNLIGYLLGILLPVKFIWALAATFLGNSRLARKLAVDAALIAATVATGGAAAPAAAGRMAAQTGAKAAAKQAGKSVGRQMVEKKVREGVTDTLVNSGMDSEEKKNREGGRQVSEQDLGVPLEPWEEYPADNIVDMTKRIPQEDRDRGERAKEPNVVDLTNRRASEEEEEYKKAA